MLNIVLKQILNWELFSHNIKMIKPMHNLDDIFFSEFDYNASVSLSAASSYPRFYQQSAQ